MDEAKPTPTFAEQMRAQYPQEFAAALQAIGADVDYGTDAEKELAASYALKQHAGELFQFFHQQMNRHEGVAIDLPPNVAARLAAVGATTQDLRDFASAAYPHVTSDQALKLYERDLQGGAGASDLFDHAV